MNQEPSSTKKGLKLALTEEDELKQKYTFDSLNLNKNIFSIWNANSSFFTSNQYPSLFSTRVFASQKEMKEKIVGPMNREFGCDKVYTCVTESYLYLKCNVKGCEFKHGYTYFKAEDGSICNITSSPKVSVIHKHSI